MFTADPRLPPGPVDRLQRLLERRRPASRVALLAWALARYAIALLRDVLGGEISLRAMSLVYTTLLSIVPMLAIAFSLLKALGVHNSIEPVLRQFLAPLGPQAGDLAQNITHFVDNVRVGVLGSVGVGLLLYTAVSLIAKVESSFNVIWEIGRTRALPQRFGEYLAVLIVGPVLVFSAFGLTASVRSGHVLRALMAVQPFGATMVMLSHTMPYVLMFGAFSFVYGFLPNTRVSWKAAAVGGLFAGVTWQVASVAFATFVARLSNYNAIYSGFAIIIFLLIWIYVGWLILLLGCRLAFYIQHPGRVGPLEVDPPPPPSRESEVLALDVIVAVFERFAAGEPGLAAPELARQFGVARPRLENVLRPLKQNRVLVEAADGGLLLPGRDMDSFSMGELWIWMRGAPAPGASPRARDFIESLERRAVVDTPTLGAWLRHSRSAVRWPANPPLLAAGGSDAKPV